MDMTPSFSSIRVMRLLLFLVAVASPELLISGQTVPPQNITEDCERDWNRYLRNRGRIGQEWANKMWDAQGKVGSGLYDGHMFFEGDYHICRQVNENNTRLGQRPIKGLFCVGWWHMLIGQKKGLGFCIPDTCTDLDANILFRELAEEIPIIPPLELQKPRAYCIRDKDLSQDAGAINTIVILCLFGLIVIVATIVDVYCYSKPSPDSQGKHSNRVRNNPETGDIHLTAVRDNTNQGDTHSTTVKDNTDKSTATVRDNTEREEKQSTTVGDNTTSDADTSKMEVANGVHQNGHSEMHNVNGLRNPQNEANGNAVYDIVQEQVVVKPKKPNIPMSMLLAFSLNQNVPRLLNFTPTPNSFHCLNGIRVISTIAVVFGHTYNIGLFGIAAPLVSNRYSSVGMMYKPYIEFVHHLPLVVDTFFCLGGLLVTYSFLNMLTKKRKVTVKMMIMYVVHRYWRLTPVYMIVLMIYATLFYYFGNGPFMSPIIWGHYKCDENWWQNLLYIQNLWPPESISGCMGWTWYLNLDMQFYIMAPAFIITIYYRPKIGIALLVAGYTGSLIANIVLFQKQFDPYVTIDNFVQIYIKPWTRAVTYFLGMMLGYILFKTKDKKLKLKPWVVALGWFLSLSLIWICMYIPYLNRCDNPDVKACHPWSVSGNIAYNSLVATMYILGVCWIIFACVKGYGGFINIFLSWNGWLPLARLSYTTYLIHYMVIEEFYYTMPKQLYQYQWGMQYQFCGHIVVSTGAALILSLVFEKPMLGLEKVLLPSK